MEHECTNRMYKVHCMCICTCVCSSNSSSPTGPIAMVNSSFKRPRNVRRSELLLLSLDSELAHYAY